MALVARFADAWITYGDSSHRDSSAAGTEAAIERQLDALAQHCARLGRDPGSVDRMYLSGNTDERPTGQPRRLYRSRSDDARPSASPTSSSITPRHDDPVWNDPEDIIEAIASEVLPLLH